MTDRSMDVLDEFVAKLNGLEVILQGKDRILEHVNDIARAIDDGPHDSKARLEILFEKDDIAETVVAVVLRSEKVASSVSLRTAIDDATREIEERGDRSLNTLEKKLEKIISDHERTLADLKGALADQEKTRIELESALENNKGHIRTLEASLASATEQIESVKVQWARQQEKLEGERLNTVDRIQRNESKANEQERVLAGLLDVQSRQLFPSRVKKFALGILAGAKRKSDPAHLEESIDDKSTSRTDPSPAPRVFSEQDDDSQPKANESSRDQDLNPDPKVPEPKRAASPVKGPKGSGKKRRRRKK